MASYGWDHVTMEDIARRGVAMLAPKLSKYKAVRTLVDGVNFASKAEAQRYHELKLQQRAGIISGLLLQRAYSLVVNGVHVCTYVADFEYYRADGELVIEDVKGMPTPAYRLKKKLFEALYPMKISEIRS